MKRAWRVVLAATFLFGRTPAAWAEPTAATVSGEPDKHVELEVQESGTAGTAVVPPPEDLPYPAAVAPPSKALPDAAAVVPPPEDPPCCVADRGGEPEIHAGGHFTLGAGLYALEPYFQTNPAYRRQNGLPGPNVTPIMTQTDFHYGMHAEPLTWLGYVNDCGLGARVRWWQFNVHAATAPVGPFFPSGGVGSATVLGSAIATSEVSSQAIAFASDLHMNVWDFEVTQNLTLCNSVCTFSGGIRYAHLAQDYQAGSASAFPFGGSTQIFDTLDLLLFSHNFNGAGPTFAFEGHRPLGHTGFALYGSARGAVLFGSAHQRLFTGGLQQNGSIGTSLRAETDTDSVLPVGEFEVGAEYGHCFGPVHAFAQLAFVGQVWFGAGNASNSDGVFTSGSGNSNNLGLVGLVIRAGVDF